MTPTNANGDSHADLNSKSAKIEAPIRFAGSVLGKQRHICAFFSDPKEEYRVLLPFIKEGFDRGERAFHVVDPELREEHVRQLESAGIDVDTVQQEGHFELLDWNEHYFPDGQFDENRMLAKWDTVLDGAIEKGYPRTRVVAHLDWGTNPDVLLQYEANFNLSAPRNRDPVVCTYDLNKHSSAFVIDVMRTHPMIIVGGILQENPFFIPPDEFLRELRQRNASAANATDASST
ncbi:MAG TPA: MEDS domain-containing protein [Pyrinomonadaceae bacterium]|nr:MEDS domain-containing protein [Pyrinomonadaceae bacterium]